MIDRESRDNGIDAAARPWMLIYEVDIAPTLALHAAQRRLCDELELWADRLPDRQAIVGATPVAFALEASLGALESMPASAAQGLFDADATMLGGVVFGHICRHRAANRLHAEDVYDALASAAGAAGPPRADMLGYMMRCLFDNCRRAIDYEQMALLLLAGDRLTAAASSTLMKSLCR